MCYDFSSLFASMLRSVNIPAKLVKGYGSKVEGYHAWNEVYLDGKWQTVDTSFDAQMAQNKQSFSMYKDSSKYDKVSEF
jgi:transglutaminase-like putative cysteine protease